MDMTREDVDLFSLPFRISYVRKLRTSYTFRVCRMSYKDRQDKLKSKTSFRFLGAVAIIMPQSSQKQSFHAIGEPMESQLCFL